MCYYIVIQCVLQQVLKNPLIIHFGFLYLFQFLLGYPIFDDSICLTIEGYLTSFLALQNSQMDMTTSYVVVL